MSEPVLGGILRRILRSGDFNWVRAEGRELELDGFIVLDEDEARVVQEVLSGRWDKR
jgi:hypothetical protein